MRRIWKYLTLVAAAVLLASSCNTHKDDPEETTSGHSALYSCVNTFAYNVLTTYYLWIDEIRSKMSTWYLSDEPIAKVKELRYKDASGKDIDRWTVLTDNVASFLATVSGTGRTYGYEVRLYRRSADSDEIVAVIIYTYKDSPAEKAGLKRGDVIAKVNGKKMTMDNYSSIVNSELYGSDSVKLTMLNGSELSLTSVSMYEDPVGTTAIFDLENRKVGYLHFTSFTLDACGPLIDVCRQFREASITDLVLDLRYNGGGYVKTEELLASLLAPEKAVKREDVFTTQVYNTTLTEALGSEPTKFTTQFAFTIDDKKYEYNTSGANANIEHLWVLTSGSTASASESLICGLAPYLDITLVGEKTSGKYCGGVIIETTDWFENVKDKIEKDMYNKGMRLAANWGIYVMISRYADKDGKTLSMPDGITPDYECVDMPLDGHELGDPKETMFAYVLGLIGGKQANVQTKSSIPTIPVPMPKWSGSIILPEDIPFINGEVILK